MMETLDSNIDEHKRKLTLDENDSQTGTKKQKTETSEKSETDFAIKTEGERVCKNTDISVAEDTLNETGDSRTFLVDCKDRVDSESTQLKDPLSYTHEEEFTSEIYKIQIHDLPKFGFNQLKKRLKGTLGLDPHKIKSADRHFATYVCFRNEADRQEALKKINGHVWKGKTLSAVIAAPSADPYLQKHHNNKGRNNRNKASNSGNCESTPVEKLSLTPEEAEERLKANVTPLWKMEYQEQLKMKTEKMKEVLSKVTKHHFVKHMFQDRKELDGLPCILDPIVASPITTEYRNKNEFTIGYSLDGKVTVGFRYGLYRDGTTSVGDCTNVKVAMPAAVPVIKSFTNYLQTCKWLPYQQQTGTGHWQTLMVRTFRSGDILVMVDFVARNLTQEEIEEVKQSVKQYFTQGEGIAATITSFYFRVLGSKGKGGSKETELLFGEKHVYEQLLNLKFRISPEAFFQVNTLATEKLYELIADWSGVSDNATVLDVCCGTGTIGLSVAKKAKSVIGIEMCKEAIDDAKANASINGITNTVFHCARVEDIIAKALSSLSFNDNIIAIVDPPRAGLHKNVIKTLRKCLEIQRLVFVSCNPEMAMENFVDFIRPTTGNLKGPPFTMVKAAPIDLFPGCRHCELAILFERVSKTDRTPAGEEEKSDCAVLKSDQANSADSDTKCEEGVKDLDKKERDPAVSDSFQPKLQE